MSPHDLPALLGLGVLALMILAVVLLVFRYKADAIRRSGAPHPGEPGWAAGGNEPGWVAAGNPYPIGNVRVPPSTAGLSAEEVDARNRELRRLLGQPPTAPPPPPAD